MHPLGTFHITTARPPLPSSTVSNCGSYRVHTFTTSHRISADCIDQRCKSQLPVERSSSSVINQLLEEFKSTVVNFTSELSELQYNQYNFLVFMLKSKTFVIPPYSWFLTEWPIICTCWSLKSFQGLQKPLLRIHQEC